MKFFFKFENFYENHPPTRHIKHKKIDFGQKKTHPEHKYSLTFVSKVRTISNKSKLLDKLVKI